MVALHTFAEALARAKAGNPVFIAMTSNQAGGVVGYAAGLVTYVEGFVHQGIRTPGKLGGSLGYLFSDRLNTDFEAGAFLGQPFDVKKQDKLVLNLSDIAGNIRVHFSLETWGSEFTVDFQARNGVLVGNGPAIGNTVAEAVYVAAFADLGQSP